MRAARSHALRSAWATACRSTVRPLTLARQPMALDSAVVSLPRVSFRSYTAQAKLRAEEEEEEDNFFLIAGENNAAPSAGEPSSSQPTPTPVVDAASAAPAAEAPADGPATAAAGVPFDSLKGRINHDTLKALTFKPFQLRDMSDVQRRVLGLMPELAGGRTRPTVVEAETEEETAAREARAEGGRKDLLVKAKTGTGKTIAFLVPAIEARINTIERLAHEPVDGVAPDKHAVGQRERVLNRSRVGALIISPTRELATQIATEASKLCTWHKQMEVRLLVGGESRHRQLRDMRRGRLDFVVATPGRLKDLLSEEAVADAVRHTDLLILDEADTLLEMGFSKDLAAILEHLPAPEQRQTFLFSATVSPEIRRVAAASLKAKHEVIDCVPKNESNVHTHIPQYATVLGSAAEQIPHVLRLVAHDQLSHAGAAGGASKIVVFLPTTKQTMLFATLLRELKSVLPAGLSVHEIHSRLGQDQRSRAAERFRRDSRPSILVTSDVSARGVDYPGVTRVIQVGIPSTAEQYIHRVGRTGRGGSTRGRGDLVLLPWEAGFLRELRKMPVQRLDAGAFSTELAGLDAAYAEQSGGDGPRAIDGAVAQLMPSLDPEAVNETFMSLVGFYVGKATELGAHPAAIFDGLKEWATDAAGLERPPHISEGMMQKLGLAKALRRGGAGGARGTRFGAGSGAGRPQRTSFGMAGGAGRERGERADGGEWAERRDRGERREWVDRSDRGDRAERTERTDRGDRGEGAAPRSFASRRTDGFAPRNDGGERRPWVARGSQGRGAGAGGFGGDRSGGGDGAGRRFGREWRARD